jgi:hypothetical protein
VITRIFYVITKPKKRIVAQNPSGFLGDTNNNRAIERQVVKDKWRQGYFADLAHRQLNPSR